MNRTTFIERLLTESRSVVRQARDDADTSLAQTALQYAGRHQPVIVVASDTDTLVLLVCHVHAEQDNVGDVYMQSEVSSWKLQPRVLIPVCAVFEALGPIKTIT